MQWSISATGSTSANTWQPGKGTFTVFGTFGGTSAKLQYSVDDGVTYVDVGTDATFAAAGGVNVELPKSSVRVTATGGAGISLTASLSRIPQV